MSVVTVIFKKILGLFLGVFSLLRAIYKKAVCRSRRGRRNSGTILPLTTERITSDVPQSVPTNDMEFESWDTWGMENSVAAQSGTHQNATHAPAKPGYLSNHLLRNKDPEPEPEPEPDYFGDMQPEIRRTKKIVIRQDNDHGGNLSRLAMNSDLPPQDGELGTWDDTENAWAEEANEDLSWEAVSAIKENKRIDRERRNMEQQRKKQEKEAIRAASRRDGQFTAVRLS